MMHPSAVPIESFSFRDAEFINSTLISLKPPWCVEVAIRNDVVAVRNSNDPTKKTIVFTPDEWRSFIAGVRANKFDLP